MMWALVSFGAGADYSFANGIAVGSPASVSPQAVVRSSSAVFASLLLQPCALTDRGALIASDNGLGAFLIDPSKQTVAPFVLRGLDAEADELYYCVTADNTLVWSCRVRHGPGRNQIARWLSNALHVQYETTLELHISTLDGAQERLIGRIVSRDEDTSIRVCGASPDGKWVDFEYAGWLFTTRIK